MRGAIEFTSGPRPEMCEAERSKQERKSIVKVPYPTLPGRPLREPPYFIAGAADLAPWPSKISLKRGKKRA